MEAFTKSINRLPVPTLGGIYFWTDFRWWFGWRLQHNPATNRWRVVDARNIRRVSGSFEECDLEFNRIIHDGPAKQAPEHIVVLLHGLLRSSHSMDPLARMIEATTTATPISFAYASGKASIADHASALRHWIESLPGSSKISFVAHSLGNIVIRRSIHDWNTDDSQGILHRLSKIVMLGPPNQGSQFARRLARIGLFETLTGRAGQELGQAWKEVRSELAIPPCPFAIMSGDVQELFVQNPWIDKTSDLVVSLKETILEGATYTKTFPVLHSFLMRDPKIIKETIQFLDLP